MNNYKLIKEFEGLKLSAYLCPSSIWTIGYGTTIYQNGNKVKKGDKCSKEDAEKYLDNYVQSRIIPKLFKIKYWNDLNNNQKEAIISFAYNLGEGFYHAKNFESISKLLDNKYLWTDIKEVYRIFGLYVNSANGKLEGLINRRKKEAELFLTKVDLNIPEESNDILRMFVYYKNEPHQKNALDFLNTELLKNTQSKTILINTLEIFGNYKNNEAFNTNNAISRMAYYFNNEDWQVKATKYLYDYLTEYNNDLLIKTLNIYRTTVTQGIIPVKSSDINWNNPNDKISKYFSVYEVTQRDNRRIPTSKQIQDNILSIAKELDKIRELIDAPIIITSWYRPPAINKAVGGVSNSQHINGSAVDIYTPIMNIYKFQELLDNYWDKALGYGAKKGFVHLDLRPNRIRWNY